MGLDTDLAVEALGNELVCAICKKIILDPVCTKKCKHVFCRECILAKLRRQRACPTCHSKITAEFVSPSEKFLIALLNTRLHCVHKCGSIFKIGDLPDHVYDECPNTPKICPNAKSGCKMNVKRCELEEHIGECNYRKVECEACGKVIIYWNLFTHQSRTKCLEKKLRQTVIKATKSVAGEVKRHRAQLIREHTQLDHQKRKMMTTRAMSSQNSNRSYYSPQEKHMHSSEEGYEPTWEIEKHNSTEQDQDTNGNPDNLALVPVENEMTDSTDGRTRSPAGNFTTPNPSRIGFTPRWCLRCGKKYKDNNNYPGSCCFHPGPMIELFGGTCLKCGCLDYQPGCTNGYHISQIMES